MIDIGIVTAIYLSSDDQVLAVQGSSGSSQFLRFFDPQRCSPLGKPIVSGTDITVTANDIFVKPSCVCDEAFEARCSCQSARVIEFQRDCKPLDNSALAEKMTEKLLGLAFTGTRQVAFPSTARARFIN